MRARARARACVRLMTVNVCLCLRRRACVPVSDECAHVCALGKTHTHKNKTKQKQKTRASRAPRQFPLGLVSSSVDRSQAEGFLSSQSDKAARLMLMKIHVIGLDEEHRVFYRRKFSGSVVTSICAVEFHELSYIQDEKEVLLRDPLFQVLQLHEGGELISGRPSELLEMVMVNSNRGHLTSVQLQEQQEAAARRLFGTMVTVTRCSSVFVSAGVTGWWRTRRSTRNCWGTS